MPHHKLYEFTVRPAMNYPVCGFPVDMLRYDACWPADDKSAALMLSGSLQLTDRITLRSAYAPTVERWESFDYQVVHSEERF